MMILCEPGASRREEVVLPIYLPPTVMSAIAGRDVMVTAADSAIIVVCGAVRTGVKGVLGSAAEPAGVRSVGTLVDKGCSEDCTLGGGVAVVSPEGLGGGVGRV